MSALDTRSGRAAAAAAFLAAATLAAVGAARAFLPPYAPDAPAYRQKGPAGAQAVIADFSDFQCPSCAAAVEPLNQIQSMFPGKVRVLFKHRPWDFHPKAKEAAVAAECAGLAGKFWEYHDRLFAAQAEWGQAQDPEASFAAYARELGLDAAEFARCRTGPAAAAAVAADVAEASKRWVKSTPTFFVNGVRYVGAKQLRTSGLSRVEKAVAP